MLRNPTLLSAQQRGQYRHCPYRSTELRRMATTSRQQQLHNQKGQLVPLSDYRESELLREYRIHHRRDLSNGGKVHAHSHWCTHFPL
jgi:hypothetical protein